MQEKDLQGSSTNVEQVGTMLAEAFLARVARFSPADRIHLLKACRVVLKTDPDVSRIFFGTE